MLTKISERAAVEMLWPEFLCRDANFRALAEGIGCGIFISRGERLDYVNHAAETITAYTRAELRSKTFRDLVHPEYRELISSGGGTTQREVKIVTKHGDERWLDLTTSMTELDGIPVSLISAYDLTERKRTEEKIQLLGVTDSLTGLGNYSRFVETLDAEVKRAERTGRSFAVLLLDLDQLKRINDRYGHLVGSQALCRLADILRVFCRGIDTASRYGGDEFAVILPETTATAAMLVASRIRSRLATDCLLPPFSVSVGVAVYPQDGGTMEALLRTADRDLYRMKNGKEEAPPMICSLTSASSQRGLEQDFSEEVRFSKRLA